MRKRFFSVLMSVFLFFSCFPMLKIDANMEKRAVWISYLDFEKYLKDKNEADFTATFEEMCKNSVDLGLNTLIVHVRSFNDAVYPSENYPWAEWLTSSKTDPGYDPLQIMIDLAHKYNLKFEAWLNPYRIALKTVQSTAFMSSPYAQQYTPHDLILYEAAGEQRMILNPASDLVIENITEGIEEIVKNYDVDGIHFDDYFYQSGTMDGTSPQSRKDAVNKLVSKVYSTIKSIDEDVVFGISPQGNLDNCRGHGADIDTWLSKDGYVDYVMPQIYWTDEYGADGKTTMYSNRANEYKKIWTNKNVDLQVGLALYKVNTSSTSDLGWSSRQDNLASQVKIAEDLGYNGYALFRYEHMLQTSAKTELANLKKLNTSENEEKPNTQPEENLPTNPNLDTSKPGWQDVDDTWYFVEDDGRLKTRWLAGNQGINDWYWLNDGIMQTDYWVPTDKGWYYMDSEGHMAYDTTLTTNDERYGSFEATFDSEGIWIK